jgi:PII-like signaling protein
MTDTVEPLKRTRSLQRMTVFVAEAHHRHDRSAVCELLERAARLRLSGGTMLCGVSGFGHNLHLHEPHGLHAPDKTPYVVVFVDLPERLAELRPSISELLPGALVVTDEVTGARYIRPHRHDTP